ncbi:laminin subunit beta-3-like [Cololabis saira]|uniref:laminin subunit beta-3-like n=1 Tax=Cololabis saira TaxID=129043 RepID=UPI002AD25126|nr:laminin subunit beta-3-like [Cololabis saira]
MRILLLLAAISAVSEGQNDCSFSACYPPSNDLLLGRGHQLRASSTCGLTGSELYCTLYQQRRMKCCPCDSRNPNSQLAHNVKDMLSSSGPNRWWQSKKDVNPVTLQLDLNGLFQLDNVVLSFKGPRPSALVIERTLDNGRTWQPALHLATDCERAFPGVPTATPLRLDQTYCHALTPTDPNREHIIEFSPLRQYAFVSAPTSDKIEGVSGLTGLRVRLTELGDVPRLPGRALSRFYALKEMRVMGSCMCHGHANRCLPETYSNQLSDTIQVHPQCDCQHNTAGVNCERCAELHHDLPWRPADEANTHTCKRCECNNHSQRCHFDPAVYEASGRTSGGVCEGCMHHTTGPKCDRCAPGYQPNPYSRMDRPDACTRCSCNAEGTENGAPCEESTGSCRCKVNVEGPRCDRCRRGYHGLSASNALGCKKCSCSPDGSLSEVCDPVTGQCPCRAHFHGLTCNQCSTGYWKPLLSESCQPCGCNPTSSTSDACDQLTGQCQCRPGFGGRACSECPDNTYGDPLTGCRPCRCNAEGTETCNKRTGTCLCRPGVAGTRCDSCSPGRCDSFPDCDPCPSCFFTLDSQLKNMSLALEKFSPGIPTRPGGSGTPENFGLRVRVLEANLRKIRDSLPLPPITVTQVDDALSQLQKLRDEVEKVDNELSPIGKTPDLESELDKLQAILDNLTLVYTAKKDANENSVSPDNAEAFVTIKDAYNKSKDAAKKVTTSGKTLEESAEVREETKDIQNKVQPENTRDLAKLNLSMASQPDLTPAAKQVCGSVRTEPCTPLQCTGEDLCPPEGAPPCEKGKKCVGALPLSIRANADVKDVKERLEKLSGKITDASEMLQKTQETTNQMRQSTDKLSNKMKQARDDLEDELKETRDVVRELKDFLSDPSSNLTQVQEVSDWILKAKLPVNLADLKRKLEELKNLAANLPNSKAVLREAEPQLEAAKKLLKEAQDARDVAVGTKADVDGLLDGFGSAENALSNLEDRLQDSMDLIDGLNDNLMRAQKELSPAEKALDDVSTLLKPTKPQLDELKNVLEKAGGRAQDVQDDADRAEDEAAAAEQDLLTLEKQLDRLKEESPSGETEEGVPTGDRLAKLREEAGALANTTNNMMQSLEGKADTLRELQDNILTKSARLEGLDVKVKELLEALRYKARILSTCQG